MLDKRSTCPICGNSFIPTKRFDYTVVEGVLKLEVEQEECDECRMALDDK